MNVPDKQLRTCAAHWKYRADKGRLGGLGGGGTLGRELPERSEMSVFKYSITSGWDYFIQSLNIFSSAS